MPDKLEWWRHTKQHRAYGCDTIVRQLQLQRAAHNITRTARGSVSSAVNDAMAGCCYNAGQSGLPERVCATRRCKRQSNHLGITETFLTSMLFDQRLIGIGRRTGYQQATMIMMGPHTPVAGMLLQRCPAYLRMNCWVILTTSGCYLLHRRDCRSKSHSKVASGSCSYY